MDDLVLSLFTFCVQIMRVLAEWSGLTYKEINALLFLVVQPSLILLFAALWWNEKRKSIILKKLKSK